MIDKKRMKPFILSALVIIIDQITKALVCAFIPVGTCRWSFWNDYLRIIHVRNDAVAFSLGTNLGMFWKILLFIIVPLVLLVAVSVWVYRDKKELTELERWCFALFIGGGFGNLIDRIFRGMSVVDFISTNNYGVFGLDRWPTWNIADGAVVCSVVLLLFAIIFTPGREKKNAEQES